MVSNWYGIVYGKVWCMAWEVGWGVVGYNIDNSHTSTSTPNWWLRVEGSAYSALRASAHDNHGFNLTLPQGQHLPRCVIFIIQQGAWGWEASALPPSSCPHGFISSGGSSGPGGGRADHMGWWDKELLGWMLTGWPCLLVPCYCPSSLYMACLLQPGVWVKRHSIDLVDAGEDAGQIHWGGGRMGWLRLDEEGLGLRCAEVWEGALNLELEDM